MSLDPHTFIENFYKLKRILVLEEYQDRELIEPDPLYDLLNYFIIFKHFVVSFPLKHDHIYMIYNVKNNMKYPLVSFFKYTDRFTLSNDRIIESIDNEVPHEAVFDGSIEQLFDASIGKKKETLTNIELYYEDISITVREKRRDIQIGIIDLTDIYDYYVNLIKSQSRRMGIYTGFPIVPGTLLTHRHSNHKKTKMKRKRAKSIGGTKKLLKGVKSK